MTKNHTIEGPRYSKAQVCSYMGGLDQTMLDKWVASGKFPKPHLYPDRHPRWKLSNFNLYLSQKEQELREQSCG